jgi:hypothetical protein
MISDVSISDHSNNENSRIAPQKNLLTIFKQNAMKTNKSLFVRKIIERKIEEVSPISVAYNEVVSIYYKKLEKRQKLMKIRKIYSIRHLNRYFRQKKETLKLLFQDFGKRKTEFFFKDAPRHIEKMTKISQELSDLIRRNFV